GLNEGDGASSGQYVERVLLLPKKDVSILDVWHVNGLRGTGTFSFQVDDLFIPEIRTYDPEGKPREDGPLYVIPATLLFASGFATIALGNARASLNAAIDLAGKKVPGRSRSVLGDDLTTQRLVGETMGLWSSARAFLRESVSAAWEAACKNRSLTTEERIQLRLSTTYAIRRAADVVDVAYNLSGSSAIFASNPVQRRFQDAHVMTQQFQGRVSNFDSVGRFFLGLEPDGRY
ncbi:MAG: acyl-CoA dehydrogenase family protein, partial [Ardenticatenaceae bacterium]